MFEYLYMKIQSYGQGKEKLKIVQNCYTEQKRFLWASAVFTQSPTSQDLPVSFILAGKTYVGIVRVT